MTGKRKVRLHPRPAPVLPSDKAFVVQLARSTDPGLRVFTGRVEHLVSGRRRRFESVRQFLEQVSWLLTERPQRRGALTTIVRRRREER